MAEEISKILGKKFDKGDELSRQLRVVKIFDIYKALLREKFPKDEQTTPVSFSEGILRVKVKSSVAAQELRFNEKKWLAEINKTLGKPLLKKILYQF